MYLLPIDTEKSISSKRLVYEEPQRKTLEESLQGFAFLLPTIFGAIFLIKQDRSAWGDNEKLFYTMYIFYALFICPVALYRVFTRNFLRPIRTKGTFDKNLKLLRDFAAAYSYSFQHPKETCVVLTDDEAVVEGLPHSRRYFIFLLDESTIYYGSVKLHRRGYLPSLFHHWMVWIDIRKQIKKRDRTITNAH